MVIEMNDEQLHSLKDVQGFLDGTVLMDFTVAEDERYAFIARTVKRFGNGRLNRTDKAVVLRFLERVSGYSRQQIARLVKRGSERREMVNLTASQALSYILSPATRTLSEAFDQLKPELVTDCGD
jgi:hypothetical protein